MESQHSAIAREVAVEVARQLREGFVVKEWLSPAEVAQFCSISKQRLEHFRRKGGGPPFSKRGDYVRYPRKELDEWWRETLRKGGAS